MNQQGHKRYSVVCILRQKKKETHCVIVFIISVIRFPWVLTESKRLYLMCRNIRTTDKTNKQTNKHDSLEDNAEEQRRKVEAMCRIMSFRILLSYQQFILNLLCICLGSRYKSVSLTCFHTNHFFRERESDAVRYTGNIIVICKFSVTHRPIWISSRDTCLERLHRYDT